MDDLENTLNKELTKEQRIEFLSHDFGIGEEKNSASWSGDWNLLQTNDLNKLIKNLGVEGIELIELITIDDECVKRLKKCVAVIILDQEQQLVIKNEDNVGRDHDEIYFGRQIFKNICPTQAVLTALLNCKHEDVNLGKVLSDFKQYSKKFHPNVGKFDSCMHGVALSKCEEIRDIHNYLAKKKLQEFDSDDEHNDEYAFHFIVYIPCKGILYELDGANTVPIDHGVIPYDKKWLDIAQQIVLQRIQKFVKEHINFRVMAVISQID